MIENRQKLQEAIIQDARNAGITNLTTYKLRRLLKPHPIYEYIVLLRKYSYYKNRGGGWNLLSKIIGCKLQRMAKKLGFFIPEDVFGPGLYIPHFGSVIVNPHAKIGINCQINNNVVIGQIGGKCPIIGDNVYIGPGAVISGEISIADNVWIGANAVVTKSITEPYALVVGIPAKVCKIKSTNWLQEFHI